ncbi:hypothetical protein Poli38472_008556 [Pythium oligandrum]|uniref:PHD-type domain-containing protein n=1 Tax=Pythium oligandrum TaxID=41045 RepID=A0A8K1C3S4_PYTOL|nr:hypothetical protein Poli38472_008556 [Pythium oligandrum]|eukprot:TMW55908.1 hypothetical protein Poli38472_008556 [Pythium oligandrum]
MNRMGPGSATSTGSDGAPENVGVTAAARVSTGGTSTRPSSDASPPSSRVKEASAATAAAGNVLFIPIRSRVGKRYQAILPELMEKPMEDRANRIKVMHVAKPRYSLDRATALGNDLEKYLKLARSLRDGATFDTEEQVTSLALEYLHRFDYNTTDAACSLYARHSMEVPKLASSAETYSSRNNGAANEAQWLTSFYRLMRLPQIQQGDYQAMLQLKKRAVTLSLSATEAGVLDRLLARMSQWLAAVGDTKNMFTERADLQGLIYAAEDLAFETDEKCALEVRVNAFDAAYGRLKDAIERSNRRNQSKCLLEELEDLFASTTELKVTFPEMEEYTNMLEHARELKATISSMLLEDKVSLTAIRDLIAKIELVPVNFEREVELFQNKMMTAQSWLAKVRKCIPKRRTSRRGGPEPKKMDLNAIRALVDDAPCEDSAEVFEMQDLLECADEWAEKVKAAIEGGADVSLEELKTLMEEGNEMPVDMDEQKYLEAEIAAREWCSTAAAMLAEKKPLKELEGVVENAHEIRNHLHPKKQSRWKPQIERDIQAALDTTHRWLHEIRDAVGGSAFDKIFTSNTPFVPTPGEPILQSDAAPADPHQGFAKAKKPIDTAAKLIQKADRLVVDVQIYTNRLQELMEHTKTAQQDAIKILVKIGVRSDDSQLNQEEPPESAVETSTDKKIGDFAHACSLLDRIASLPFIFDEGLELYAVLHAEKDWSQRVRDALPPRQSRKKRQAKDPITLEQLLALLDESSRLRFKFPEEIKILSKELEDVASWQQKAREVIESRAAQLLGEVAMSLKKYDLLVYEKLNEVKKRLGGSAGVGDHAATAESLKKGDEDVEMKEAPMEMLRASSTLSTGQHGGPVLNKGSSEVSSRSSSGETVAGLAERIQVDSILETIRREAGCPKKLSEEQSTEDEANRAARGLTVLDPLLAMVEECLNAVNQVEVKEDKKKRLDELLVGEEVIVGPPDDAVKQLEEWREQITHILNDGNLFNAVAPEMDALSCVSELLEWLQSSRSIFYDEVLPLKELVTKGQELETRLQGLQGSNVFSSPTLELLGAMLWPLPFLIEREVVVQSWMSRVAKCMEDKHAPLDDIHRLLEEAYSLLLEPDALKIILDEVKKAKLWLAKIKKRLKSLMTKQVTRLTMTVAKSLVDEGHDIALELSAFDMLKEHVDFASDWEKRVLDSGIETGHARIANLLSLLDEYDRARLVIDLDMHRDVLKSATERYCVCRQPYDGFMIGCDYCDDWFHDVCIGLSKEKAEKVENYTCPSCSILQDLSSALTRALEGQDKLWGDTDYGKNYEKQHGVAVRRVKREEKAIERSEMLLFSCNNHMNQLRARIDDIERAKSCFTLKNPFEQVGMSNGCASSVTAQGQDPKSLTVQMKPPSDSSNASSTATSGGLPTMAIDTMAFVQRYPNILLPPAKYAGDLQQSVSGTSASSTTPGIATNAVTTQTPAGDKKPTMSDVMPSMLAPMLAKLSENTERLSALLVAGGVEQQLAKMKSEHAEVKAQVTELQETIRLSKERLVAAQASVDELKRAYVIRQHGLPRAKAWVQHVIRIINTPATLIRSKFRDTFISSEFGEVIMDAKAKEIDHFPEVKAYTHLMRTVGWTLVVVSLLQERPSREALSEVIAYASDHGLGDYTMTIAPLRAIIGRVDGWIARTQKCLSKPATTSQKLPRLKVLMNEYSKLPLTCEWISKLEEYMRLLEIASNSELSAEALTALSNAENAALGTLNAAATVGATTITPKVPRKRKSYTKKEKVETPTQDATAKKSAKKAKLGSSDAASLGALAAVAMMEDHHTTNGTPNGETIKAEDEEEEVKAHLESNGSSGLASAMMS